MSEILEKDWINHFEQSFSEFPIFLDKSKIRKRKNCSKKSFGKKISGLFPIKFLHFFFGWSENSEKKRTFFFFDLSTNQSAKPSN